MSILFSHFFQKINQISPLEADFTEVLGGIALTPKMLYFYGKLPENVVKTGKSGALGGGGFSGSFVASGASGAGGRPKTVAIVGSRHNTRYGEEVAYKLAYELGKRGVIVVSGLAYGIDSIGHRGCLDGGGKTIAVLGTAIDDIYPKSHLPLAERILETGGAIISEYAPRGDRGFTEMPLGPAEAGWDGERWIPYEEDTGGPYLNRRIEQKLSFLQRNRIISGLSDIVVVVEAAVKSGSLSTAAHALAQGKTVFAVPGNITSPYSQGCNKLISQGAIPYTGPNDILRELFPEDFAVKRGAKREISGDNDIETAILKAISRGIRSGEEIMKATLLPPELFNQATTMLEIKGRIRALGMNNWGLA